MLKERIEKYWICQDCVKTKYPRWKYPAWPVTVVQGLCGHCEREDECMLIPVVDFIKEDGKDPVWD